ncbi:MAG: ribosomal protein S18-alanine N-acetyltransferase, partial [Brevefilum sp.]|nr:ribosomal protein S18-alanine N-acetyltransferase [Brevefilum sp.]
MSEKTADLQINLRPMTLADLDQVESLDRASFPTPWPKEAFLFELKENRPSVCWVAELKSQGSEPMIVGSVVIWLVVDEAHIGTLAVRPGYRQQGIAQRLLAAALFECVQRGAEKALLEVRASNQPAQELYRKFGFAAVGLRRGYYQDTHEDAVLMTLEPMRKQVLIPLMDY